MVRVLFVHGMNHENRSSKYLEDAWFPLFRRALAEGRAARRYSGAAPPVSLGLLYWGDLFGGPIPDTAPPLQGVSDDVAKLYFAFVRRMVLWADKRTKYDPLARPRSLMARLINRAIQQTAMYMANAPIPRVTDTARPNVYDEIQSRFREWLNWNPDIVIGHSLGSVIAYEGLCQSQRRVPALLSVGSPIGVPDLIYDKLRPPGSRPRFAPNVREWINVSNVADPMVVPVPRISQLFREPVRDVVFERGKAGVKALSRNHMFIEYLKTPEVHAVIADAIEAAAGQGR